MDNIFMTDSLYGNYRTRKFTDIWSNVDAFITDWHNSPFYSSENIADSDITLIYYLLYCKYGNSHITNSDEYQWKMKLMSFVWTYSPTFLKRLEIQSTLRNLSESDLLEGGKKINDHAYNPSTIPEGPNVTDGELQSVNEQVKSKYKKSKLEAYSNLLPFLQDNITDNFIVKFKGLFLTIVEPQEPLWYISEEDN